MQRICHLIFKAGRRQEPLNDNPLYLPEVELHVPAGMGLNHVGGHF